MSSEANEKLILALPKGRILKEAAPVFARAGIEPEAAFADPIAHRKRREVHHLEVRRLVGMHRDGAASTQTTREAGREARPRPRRAKHLHGHGLVIRRGLNLNGLAPSPTASNRNEKHDDK